MLVREPTQHVAPMAPHVLNVLNVMFGTSRFDAEPRAGASALSRACHENPSEPGGARPGKSSGFTGLPRDDRVSRRHVFR